MSDVRDDGEAKWVDKREKNKVVLADVVDDIKGRLGPSHGEGVNA